MIEAPPQDSIPCGDGWPFYGRLGDLPLEFGAEIRVTKLGHLASGFWGWPWTRCALASSTAETIIARFVNRP